MGRRRAKGKGQRAKSKGEEGMECDACKADGQQPV